SEHQLHGRGSGHAPLACLPGENSVTETPVGPTREGRVPPRPPKRKFWGWRGNRPSRLMDPRVIYCGDDLEQHQKPLNRVMAIPPTGPFLLSVSPWRWRWMPELASDHSG